MLHAYCCPFSSGVFPEFVEYRY